MKYTPAVSEDILGHRILLLLLFSEQKNLKKWNRQGYPFLELHQSFVLIIESDIDSDIQIMQIEERHYMVKLNNTWQTELFLISYS